jgi:hypothetical protein
MKFLWFFFHSLSTTSVVAAQDTLDAIEIDSSYTNCNGKTTKKRYKVDKV